MKRVLMVGAMFLIAGCDRAEQPKSVSNATNAAHCVNALWSALEGLKVSPENSALVNPWSISGKLNPENQLRLRCEVVENGFRAWVTADVICDNVDDEACVRVVDYERSDEPFIPAIKR